MSIRARYFLGGLLLMQLLVALLIRPPKESVLREDAVYYYSWLPAVLVRHDVRLQFLDTLPALPHRYSHNTLPETGQRVFKMPPGVAIMEIPAFLAAQWIAPDADEGFSLIHAQCIRLWAILLSFFACILLYKLLLERFEDLVARLVIVALVLGSNLYYYMWIDSGMSHTYTFSCTVFLWWRVDALIRKGRGGWDLGLWAGLLFLIRHTNLLLLPYFAWMLWQNGAFKRFPFRMAFGFVCFGGLVGLQIIYIHHVTGYFWANTYGREGFFWMQPYFTEVLLSFRKGWFIYTPIMVLVIPGFFLLYRQHKQELSAILLPMLLFVYAISSWWCWWYGGSFGMRALIDYYALLSIPLGYAIQRGLMRFARIFKVAIACCILLNVWQSYQYAHGILHWDAMTARSYREGFFRWQTPKSPIPGWKHPDYERSVIEREPYW